MIVINEKYAIGSDPMNWIIYRKVKANPKSNPKGWEAKYYFSSIEGAIKEVYQLMLRSGSYESMAELVELARITESVLDRTFCPDFHYEMKGNIIKLATGEKDEQKV